MPPARNAGKHPSRLALNPFAIAGIDGFCNRLFASSDALKFAFERVFHEKHPSSWHPGFGTHFLSTLLHESFYFQYALVIITIER